MDQLIRGSSNEDSFEVTNEGDMAETDHIIKVGLQCTESEVDSNNIEVNLTGISGGKAENVTAIGILKGQIMVSRDHRLKSLRDKTIKEAQKLSKKMVRTRAVEDVLKKITTHQRWITICGHPGEGKTTTGYMVLQQLLENQLEVFKVDCPEDYFTVVRKVPRCVIMMNDVFGAFGFDSSAYSRWEPVIHHFLERPGKEGDDVKDGKTIIFVSRLNVLQGAKIFLGQYESEILGKDNIINLSVVTENSGEERLQILDFHLNSIDDVIPLDVKERVVSSSCPFGFALCCKMFADLKRSGNSVPDIETFFSKPLQFLERTTKVLIAKPEIKNLFKKMLKNNGRVTIESLTDETERESCRQVTDELRGCYVKEMDDTFEFSNPSVHESVALAIGHLDPTFALEFLDEAFLLQKVIFDDLSETPNNGFLYMKPTDNVIKHLCIRLSPLLLRFDFSILQPDVCKRDDLCTQLLKMNVEVKRFGNHLKSFLKCKKETKIDINSRDRYGDTLLHVAHRGKNQAAIETLLTLGADVNVCNKRWGKEGLSYFELACTDKTIHKNLLIELVDRGAKINRPLPNGDSVLHQLYHRGESHLFEYLLQKGANPNVLDAKRKTVLHYMCKNGANVEDIEVLLNHRADVNKVKKSRKKYEERIYKKEKIREKKGKTALHYLCTKECDIKVLRLLVKQGAKVNIQDLKGRTPLHYACGHKNLKVMKELLYYGSDVNAVDDAGNTPLHYLYDNGNTEGMELLLDKGADVNKTTGSDGKTLLHYECQRGEMNLDFLQLLLKYGSDVNKRRKKPHLPNRLGKTALHYLAKRDSAQTEPAVKLLMKHGADVNVRDGKGKTPLYYSFERKNDKIFSVLLDHNSDVNIADNNGMTVLQRAFEEAQTDVLKEILRRGTDVNKPDKVGKTLLHYICMREVRDLSLLDLLLQNGADVNKRKVYNLKQIESTDNISEKMHKVVKSFQDKGKTALHYACKFQSDFAVIEKLLNHGASVNVKDRHEMTPLHYLLANDDFALRDLQHLVRSGGDIHGINKNGHTGIHLLSTRRAVDYQILEYLIKCGVDCSRRDRDGRTALEYLGNSDETLQARELLDEHTRNS